ncbi:DUF4392 domain-containing protein [Marinobacterium sp. AK62]|uniref:DUF4392 domain-containing protein n=1 Tax=Marinobacterium alkalitolerans TaxID=1542925 RepID=A0ABS3Z810_9GAMM|nr:DUF4392 domain-containing protein [Marinobacterium alkalitolerans]MBP0047383.1 DUF4392 domain-containing protein [Marinobacterium alkalitolerans]
MIHPMMEHSVQDAMALSHRIEDLLVKRNLRGMAQVQASMLPGYCLRAALMLQQARGTVLIGTGFPVAGTFETDGPVGAISLYQALEQVGLHPVLVCGDPLASALEGDYRIQRLPLNERSLEARRELANDILAQHQPSLVISIERPGQAEDADYYNMRGESIGQHTASFDEIMHQAGCPTIAIGDGGNEIGMGNVRPALQSLDIKAAVTRCNELVVADVSNWGGHALIALLGWLIGRDLLEGFDNTAVLQYLSERGSVDGVTRLNELTEDSLPAADGQAMLLALRQLTGFA